MHWLISQVLTTRKTAFGRINVILSLQNFTTGWATRRFVDFPLSYCKLALQKLKRGFGVVMMNFLGLDLPGPGGLMPTASKPTVMVVRRNLCKRLGGNGDTWEYRSSICLIGTDPKHDAKVAEAMGRFHYQYVDFRNFNESLFFEDIQTATQGCLATPEPMMDGVVELLNIVGDLGYDIKTCVVIQNADGSTTTVWTATKKNPLKV